MLLSRSMYTTFFKCSYIIKTNIYIPQFRKLLAQALTHCQETALTFAEYLNSRHTTRTLSNGYIAIK